MLNNEIGWDILLQSSQIDTRSKRTRGSLVCEVCNKNELSNELVRRYLKRSESLDILTLEGCREMKFLIDE